MRDADAEDDYVSMFRAQYASLARAVNVVVLDRAVAEEVVQEAFVQLWRSWDRISTYEQPGAWVRRVALRLAVRSATRDRGRRARERQVEAGWPDPEPDLALREAVRALSPQQRAVVVLFYLEDKPVADIAAALRVSTSTVKQHLMRARQRLAVTLGQPEDDHADR